MSARVSKTALDYAARLIAAAIGVAAVARDPIGPDEGDEAAGDDTKLIAALSEGVSQQGEYLMGAASPFEFSHAAGLELIALGGGDSERRARVETALLLAAAAVAADPTLGGLVDWAELTEADPDIQLRFAAAAAQLNLTYSAPTALG